MKEIDSKYVTAWRNRFLKYEAESLAVADRAREELREAVRVLRKYGARRVVLFGSLCRTGRFHAGSDIDLAVEGIASRDFNRASADVMMAMDWPIDLKPLEQLDDSFRNAILEKGEIIYAK